jgi:hypothetical protein
MATTATQQSKHQWQSRPHRVRLFVTAQGLDELFSTSAVEKFHKVVNEFKRKEPSRYQWLEENDVKLDWIEDDYFLSYARKIIIVGDLTESQYIDYILRFFKHLEEWK